MYERAGALTGRDRGGAVRSGGVAGGAMSPRAGEGGAGAAAAAGGELGRSAASVPVARLPRYALPNLTSILPDFVNSEQDFIRRTFQASNYDRLSTLPDDIRAQRVHEARLEHIDKSLHLSSVSVGGSEDGRRGAGGLWGNSGAGGGLFQEVEYISSPYGLADQISALESEASEFKRREVGHGEDFRPGGSLKKLPHEDGFVEGGTFPYHADPYERAGDQILRYRWMMEARAVSGPFVPSGLADKALGYLNEGPAKPTRALLRNLIGKIRAHLAEDWSDADLDIFVTRGEEWAICFRVDTVDSVPGLVAYMNNFLRCSELVNQNGLTKVVESWNLRPHWDPTNIFFTLRPPWVRRDRNEAYFRLHPETRTFQALQRADETKHVGRVGTEGSELSD